MGKLHAGQITDDVPQQNYVELVVGVQRKIVMDQNSAARPERQPFDVLVLRQVRRHLDAVADGPDLRIAHRQAADLARRREVRLKQRRRHSQNFGDIVEPVAFVIGGKQRRYVYFQTKQIADRVGILGPVQPMQGRPPRLRVRRVRSVERRLQPGDHPIDFRLGRPRHALRRHHPAAQLAHNFLPRLGMIGHVVDVHLVEHQARSLGLLVMTDDAILIYQSVLWRDSGGLCMQETRAGKNQTADGQPRSKTTGFVHLLPLCQIYRIQVPASNGNPNVSYQFPIQFRSRILARRR